ncbi:MAG: ATPase [Saprospiraceae bacterium]|nr:MAG: argininosuccinate lyase [Candidatus Parvibacillus calidus]MBX2936212.1 ATPase [Saprospiraceae bacterium]MBK7739026.1 ATPase [Candidatus Parvibacillus calidus]MBX7178350.1 ATPase [Saprospiraceae bacterium]MCB0591605.1 ATPase [Saprospiraceae bacterium]
MATFLCIASYYKGNDFLIACKEAGNKVYLVTSKGLEDKPWARSHIDNIFYIQEDQNDEWNLDDLIKGTAFLMRSEKIDRVVALDDFDVEKAAALRETFRLPGMGQTTAHHFRDKLSMRMKAFEKGIKVPAFSGLFNDDEVNHYLSTVKAPWLIKPRGEASATGIVKCHTREDAWTVIQSLGDKRYQYLIEQFRPGDVYHVDAINDKKKVVFAQVSKYVNTPMEVSHGGGIFRSHTVEYDSYDDKELQKLNADIMKAFGMNYSATHTEFIKCHEDGHFYFLETASRVGGAHLAEMVEFATGVGLWTEWAKVESHSASGTEYRIPKKEKFHAGIIISLSKYECPDYSDFDDDEIVWKLDMEYHIGIIVKSMSLQRIKELLEKYADIIKNEFHAAGPLKPVKHKNS